MPNSSHKVSIFDDSGLLALADVERYSSFVSEEWTYEEIIVHFEAQMKKRSLLVWECGDGGGEYAIEVMYGSTSETGFREVEGFIVATTPKLHFVSYDSLTMAAQFEDERLPNRHEADAFIAVQPGAYRVKVIQRFDPARAMQTPGPDFIVELEPGEGPEWTAVPWLRT